MVKREGEALHEFLQQSFVDRGGLARRGGSFAPLRRFAEPSRVKRNQGFRTNHLHLNGRVLFHYGTLDCFVGELVVSRQKLDWDALDPHMLFPGRIAVTAART